MDLVDVIRIGLRRWYVAVPAAILVVVASFAARASVELTYKSTGSLLLIAPRDANVAKNRMLGFGSLTVPASVSAQVVGDATTREKLFDLGASSDYDVGLDPGNPAPLVIAVATGGLEQATKTVELVLGEVSADLARRQEALGAPPETWITTEVVTPPTRPLPQSGSRTRVFIAVFIVGAGVAGMVTIVADRLMGGVVQARRRTFDDDYPDAYADDRRTDAGPRPAGVTEPRPGSPPSETPARPLAAQAPLPEAPEGAPTAAAAAAPPPVPGPARVAPAREVASPDHQPPPADAEHPALPTPLPVPRPSLPPRRAASEGEASPSPRPTPAPAGAPAARWSPPSRRHPYLVSRDDEEAGSGGGSANPARKSGTE